MIGFRFSFLLAAMLALAVPVGAAEPHWQGVAATVTAAVDDVVARFEAGDHKAARAALTQAYFGRFEESKMETAVRQAISQDRAVEVEGMFADIRTAMKAGDLAEVKRLAATLRQALKTDAKALDDAKVAPETLAVTQ